MNYIRWIPSADSCEGFGICQILLNAGDLHAWWTLTRYDGCKRGLAEQDQCYAEAVEFAITLTKFSHIYVALCSFMHICLTVRPADIPDQGFLCDLLWSDPSEAQLRTLTPVTRAVMMGVGHWSNGPLFERFSCGRSRSSVNSQYSQSNRLKWLCPCGNLVIVLVYHEQ